MIDITLIIQTTYYMNIVWQLSRLDNEQEWNFFDQIHIQKVILTELMSSVKYFVMFTFLHNEPLRMYQQGGAHLKVGDALKTLCWPLQDANKILSALLPQ